MKNVDYFKTWSASMAYILGFILADGCIVHKDYCKTTSNFLALGIHTKDRCILEFIRDEIYPEAKIRDVDYIRKTGENIGKHRIESTLSIYSRIIVEDLMRLGIIPRKTGKEVIPPGLPDKFFPDFLRGVFDGDGCVMSKKYPVDGKLFGWYAFDINCANEEFLVNLRLVLTRLYPDFNFLSSINNKMKGQCFRWRLRRRGEICKLGEEIYYEGHPFSLLRKREILQQIMSI